MTKLRSYSLLLMGWIVLYPLCSWSQDSAAYELQRQKINELLQQRSTKFGQYDESLKQKTGIFGLQTKKDIRHSNEILRQIALSDNLIFQEIKTLLDYKNWQFEQARHSSQENQDRILNYRKTIKELQDVNQSLVDLLAAERHAKARTHWTYLLLIALAAGAAFWFRYQLHRSKRKIIQNVSLSGEDELKNLPGT